MATNQKAHPILDITVEDGATEPAIAVRDQHGSDVATVLIEKLGGSGDALTVAGDATVSGDLAVTGDQTVTSGQLLLPDGSAAAPSLSFSNDPDTGIFLNSAGNMRVVTAATNRLVFGTGAVTLLAPLSVSGQNITTDTTTGTKIGTATTQKLGFWNATPVVQQEITGEFPVTPTATFNAAMLQTILTALDATGILLDSTTQAV